MRAAIILTAAGLALAACGPKSGPAGAAAPAPTRVIADPPAQTPAEQALMSQVASVRAQLMADLPAKNCRNNGAGTPCRNLTIPCAFEDAVSPSDQALGVARRVIFLTGFDTQSAADPRWQPAGEYIRVEIGPDGNWGSASATDRYSATCAGETDDQKTRVMRFSP